MIRKAWDREVSPFRQRREKKEMRGRRQSGWVLLQPKRKIRLREKGRGGRQYRETERKT